MDSPDFFCCRVDRGPETLGALAEFFLSAVCSGCTRNIFLFSVFFL